MTIPLVIDIAHVPTLRGTGTDVRFENGVTIKMTRRMSRNIAAEQAIAIYRDLLTAGFTEAELLDRFGAREASNV